MIRTTPELEELKEEMFRRIHLIEKDLHVRIFVECAYTVDSEGKHDQELV
jgi:hypothetical protein